MSVDMSQFFEVFFDETAEHLAAMESLLLKLDVDAPNLDDLNAIFRAAHSIKGGSGTFGFTDMTEVTHILETLLDRLRKEELRPRREMIDAFLEAGDVLKAQLESHRDGSVVDEAQVAAICARLTALASDTASAEISTATPETSHYTVTFKRVAKSKLENLLQDLQQRGAMQIVEESSGDKSFTIALDIPLGEAELRDLLEFVVSPKQYTLAAESTTTASEDDGFGFFDDAPGAPSAEADDGFGFFVSDEELKAQKEEADGFGFFEDAPGTEALSPSGEESPRNPGRRASDRSDAPAVPTGRRDGDRIAVQASAEQSSIRVGIDKVDHLINLVGELVITQAMLAQTTANVDPVLYEQLVHSVAQLERNTRDLQESVMSIRMLPISFVFSRFPRVVRDVAGKLGKQVELRTIGEGTELDKGLIEKITDPLTHLVRNSLDHGIESPERRIAAGKDPKGTLTLRASHQGGNIVIEVSDDGGGLNREKILAKAREKGLGVSDGMSDSDVYQLIFAPGFSTADQVTDVSGRGVGMDVVKRNIEGLGGRVELSSTPGKGTTVTIRLPLTLAILDGMSVSVGDEIFIIPLTYIKESLQPGPGDVRAVAGEGRVVNVRGDYLPLVPLHAIFNIRPQKREPHDGILVIIESDTGKAALFVDELVGQHQVVIKSLETNFRKVQGISAATIMGDGKVALILDVAALARMSNH